MTLLISWLFLAVAVWGGLWTLISFRPPHKPGLFMVAGFFAAWSTTELAPIHLLWQAIATVVFIALGALDYWPGWIALAITFVSWFGLASSVKGALQTDRAFTVALADNSLVEPNVDEKVRVSWSRILLPLHFKRKGVRRIKNIDYAGDGKRRHRLDVYRARDHEPGAPVLLQIHGGAWMIGNKDQQGLPLMYHLASRGWVCVAINYRLSPRATWPDHLLDCKRALAWIREHIAEYGGDPDYVVVTGGSAGGHLTAMMGLTANEPEWQPGFEDADTSVRAMIPFYGVFDWTGTSTDVRDDGLREILEKYIVKQKYDDAPEVFKNASPMFHMRADAPPALVVHGDLDTLAPVEEAREFVARLRKTSKAPVTYVELKGAHHAFEVFNSIRTMHTIAGVGVFLDWLVTVDPPGRAPSRSAADQVGNAAPADAVSDPRSTAYTAHPPAPPGRAIPGRS
jgi:acetyl esterase/lipase